MSENLRSKSTGPRSKSGKAVSAQNATSHGLTSSHALPDEVAMVNNFSKELVKYYKPESPLETLQIQRIAFCRAKLAKLIDIEIAGRELYRREIENNPQKILEKIPNYPERLKQLLLMELRGRFVLEVLGIDEKTLKSINKEISESVVQVDSADDLVGAYPKLTAYLRGRTPKHTVDTDIQRQLIAFVRAIESERQTANVADKNMSKFETMLTQVVDEAEKAGKQPLLENNLSVLRGLGNDIEELKSLRQSYEDMKSWMLRSADLNAQESDRMMRYQTMLEKRLSTAIGELLELQKLRKFV